MQSVSDNVRALVARYAKITLTVYLDGVKSDVGVGACELAAACGDDESFSFGNACATSINLAMGAAMPNIKGKKLRVTWSVDGTEYPLFDGKVEDAWIRAGRTAVEGWDAMYYGGSDAFVAHGELLYDVDAAVAFALIATRMGVEAAPEAVEQLTGILIAGGMGNLPEETSLSAVAGYIAGLVGGNALIDRSGRLTVRQIRQVDYQTEPYDGGANAQSQDFTVSGLTLQREDIVKSSYDDGSSGDHVELAEYSAGDGTLLIGNPLADQAAADRAFGVLEGLTFRPGTYAIPGGILLEPGDVITVRSMDGAYRVATVMLTLELDGGAKATVACGGYAPEGGAQGAINQALAALTADFARLRSLVAENARITSARISHLTTDDIVAGQIRSTDFSVEELEEIYPGADLYPAQDQYPNDGEQIIRGFEIDFESGIIRGVFWSEDVQSLKDRVEELERRLDAIAGS